MASFKFSIGQVNITDFLLVVARISTNPTAEAARQDFAGPQPTSRNIEFDNLDPAVYYFDFRDSVDGIDLGTLMGTYTVDVKEQQILAERRFYLVGGSGAHDPAAKSNEIDDPYLDGKNVTGVFKEGFRYLVSPDYTFNEYTLVVGGGILLNGGKTFTMDEVVAIEITYTQSSLSSTVGGFPTDFVLKTADFAFDSTYYGLVIEANKAATLMTVTMPALSTIPDGIRFGVNTHQATQRYVNLQMLTGDYALVGGNQRNAVFIGKGEEVIFQKKGLYLRILSWTGDWRRVGELVQQDSAPLNSIQEIGGWQLFTDYPRLFYWYVNALPLGLLGTGTYPTTPDRANITKWIIDSVNGRMWIPNTQALFNRATNGGNPSIWSDQSLQDHRHWTGIDKTTTNSVFPHSRGTALTALRAFIKAWTKSGSGAEGYELDSDVDEPGIGRSSLPITPGTTSVAGVLINSAVTKPASVDRNFYRII